MINYLKFNCSSVDVINKVNECVRILNNGKEQQNKEIPHGQIAICSACRNEIIPGRPVATGVHCIICGGGVSEKVITIK